MVRVIIAADICPIGSNQALLKAGNASALLTDLLPEIEQADIAVSNLECPLIEKQSPIRKTGPNFGEPPACIRGIQQAGFDVLNLANNHILDHGPQGLRSTIETCKKAGIATVGAGENLEAARRLLVLQAGGLRIGFLSMAEHEFSMATEKFAGANPLDLIDFVRNTRERRSDYDYLIVLLHGAHEFQPITPRIQNTCRFLVEMGANAVIVQHPHTLGGYETYRGGHIVYGQGALLMDEAIYRDRASFHEGFLVKLTVAPDVSSTMEIIPFTQSNPQPGACRLQGEREAQFQRRLEERSRKILDESFVQEEWLHFCEQHKHGYIASLLGFNCIMHKLNRGGFLARLLYGKRPLLGVRNLVQCETHREAIQTIFDERLV